MKIKYYIILLGILILLGGCATCPTKNCPPQDVIFRVDTPYGPIEAIMKKGFFDEKYKGDLWLPLREIEKREIKNKRKEV